MESRSLPVAFVLLCTACSGQLIIPATDILPPASCADVVCPLGKRCVQGTCVSNNQPPCSAQNPSGDCGVGWQCVAGICYPDETSPHACAPGVNGYCADPSQACVDGACVTIDPAQTCSTSKPDGLCPGGQICVEGWCFVDDGVACSAARPQGLCPSGQRCVSGLCSTDPGTCSATMPGGTCPSWETCVQGQCVGPVAPDVCSPDLPDGRCPVGEICVAGTCTPIDTSNACGPGNPNGLCPAGAACSDSHCVAITPDNACGPAHPAGLCPGGARCVDGLCVQTACANGGLQCNLGEWCSGGTCLPLPCDPIHPNGLCALDPVEVCDRGVCLPPSCSLDYPNGTCAAEFVCDNGTCVPAPCSSAHPAGACPTGDVCDNGTCVEGPCTIDNQDGVCTGTARTCNPTTGCDHFVPLTCCSTALSGQTGCGVGQCTPTPCSGAQADGACPFNQYCDAATCKPAPCGRIFPEGQCAAANERCVSARCVKTGCTSQGATQAEWDAYCAPDVCDAVKDICTRPPCSLANPDGVCPILGQACCNAARQASQPGCTTIGDCFSPQCSPEFPGAPCSGGDVCAGGTCVKPPCSAQHPTGSCGPNYECIGGSCQLAACGPTAPKGSCPPAERCDVGICKPYVCSPTFPTGPCPVGSLCGNDASCGASTPCCFTPACSLTYPGGACPAGQVCNATTGTCKDGPCSATYPSGTCGAGFTCNLGICEPAPCSPTVPNGTCASAGDVCFEPPPDPPYTASCVPYACGTSFPNGPCPVGQVCLPGSVPAECSVSSPCCQVPPCSSTYIGGTCPSPDVCVNGACITPACSPTVQTGTCPATQICCNSTLVGVTLCTAGNYGQCVLRDCGPAYQSGYCPVGEACCNAALAASGFCAAGVPPAGQQGTCVTTVCSAQFPFGQCVGPDAGKMCVGGTCVDPCDAAHKKGWCPTGFACVEGGCSLACANDADCDSISDTAEGRAAQTDTDADGAPDAFDRDSDSDLIPDAVEAGDLDLATAPVNTDGDGLADFRDLDSDNDHVSDRYEAGPAPAVPRDTNADGQADYVDTDSDSDGILDACEAADTATGLCALVGIIADASVLDSDGDGLADFRDLDSDDDGVRDAIEARTRPADPASFQATGVNSDSDCTPVCVPDYRDPDSDNDGVADADEDVNGDGIVNCQVNGQGNQVADTRPSPTCGQTTAPFSPSRPYDYNPGCAAQKCLLAESSRVHPDTDGDGIQDGQDGVFLVCSTANLKPVNVFYSQSADFALALERSYNSTRVLLRGGAQAGLTFDDTDSVTNNGSFATRGFILQRVPSAAAMAATDPDPARALIEKALAQEAGDRALMAAATDVSSLTLVINRNFTSFDGYGVVISRYRVVTGVAVTTALLRDRLAGRLDGTVSGFAGANGGPSSTDFTLVTETLYRYDNGVTGSVLVVGALAQTGASSTAQSYNYRTRCSSRTVANCTSAGVGCNWTGTACVESSNYQIPLFFADNLTSGSALTQYGDDMAALCQSLIQKNGKLDFLWTVDNSGSMAQEIGQVQISAKLFFQIFNNTEADYRVAQTTSNNGPLGTTVLGWEKQFRFDEAVEQAVTRPLASDGDAPGGRNGYLTGEFTGAVAGIVDVAAPDRTVAYTCGDGCYIESCFGQIQTDCGPGTIHPECRWTGTICEADCCPACAGQSAATEADDPACYFAGRLPDEDGSGREEVLRMSEWALYRAGATQHCAAAASLEACAALPACTWTGAACVASQCVAPAALGAAYTQETCNGNDPNPGDSSRLFDRPYGADTLEDELEPPACEWDSTAAGGGACTPSVAGPCARYTARATCTGVCATYATQVACQADAACQWFTTTNPRQCRSTVCGGYGTSGTCNADPACYWWDPPGSTNTRCVDRQNTSCLGITAQATCDANPGCEWRTNGSGACFARTTVTAGQCAWDATNVCVPTAQAANVLCSGTTQAACVGPTGGWCQWDAVQGQCYAPSKRAFRADASRFLVLLTDEEDCYLKDTNWDGDCVESATSGGLGAADPLRLARVDSFLRFFQSRDFIVFAIAGDKGVGCATAAPGNAAIAVAEGTGGGWGSICAVDLYPTIEAIVIGSIGRASPYKLEGFIDGRAVQPISSTIKVAVQVCNNYPAEYPNCAGGTHMEVVPRSRDNGFDYDAINNTLILYGSARPKVGADIVVSYRYWIDRPQPPQGNPACPCPETSAPGCACPPGKACGTQGATNICATRGTQATCEGTPGCAWSTADTGKCFTNGLCEPDPSCGGACGAGTVCDPTLGLCVCDPSCGGGCPPGQTCDNNTNIHACAGLSQAACAGTSGCSYDTARGACYSTTCGDCLCDTTCGGGCPAGQLCDSNPGPTCGQCACDTTCGGGCPVGQTCDNDLASPSCGFCKPPTCGSCPAGSICDPGTGLCMCDVTCGGGCPVGTVCDANGFSGTCGQCVCDLTCGGACPGGQVCDDNPASGTCGLCQADPTCGLPPGGCNIDCSAGTTSALCAGISGCRWAPWMNGGAGACEPVVCKECNPTTGFCAADATCCDACGPAETCNTLTGKCECDTSCGYACAPGLTCDASTTSPTCGLCLCDTTCGGGCAAGQVCDNNSTCSGLDQTSCPTVPNCAWDMVTMQCLSVYCGQCVVDPTCGGCPPGQVCNPTTGVCVPECPQCPPGFVCEPVTGTCICDTTCGGTCPAGQQCDTTLASPTCGRCVCETTCGGSCPAGQVCDSTLTSPTCGLCVCDTTCGGGCGALGPGYVCDPVVCLCVPIQFNCPPGYEWNPIWQTCVRTGG